MVSFSLCWGKENCGRGEKGAGSAGLGQWPLGNEPPPVKPANPLRKQAALVAGEPA